MKNLFIYKVRSLDLIIIKFQSIYFYERKYLKTKKLCQILAKIPPAFLISWLPRNDRNLNKTQPKGTLQPVSSLYLNFNTTFNVL